jgi:hypothetical protein
MIWVGKGKYERKLREDVSLMKDVLHTLRNIEKRWPEHPRVRPLLMRAVKVTRKCMREHLTYDPRAERREELRRLQKEQEEYERAAEEEARRRARRQARVGASKYAKYAEPIRKTKSSAGEDLIRSLMF